MAKHVGDVLTKPLKEFVIHGGDLIELSTEIDFSAGSTCLIVEGDRSEVSLKC